MRIVVIGAGLVGAATAGRLAARRHRVTLIDAWGPGNSRASSGGDTRVIRATYGPDRIYVEMVARALVLWQESQRLWNRPLLRKTGVLWMAGPDDRYEKASLPLIRAAGLPAEELSVVEAARRYPQIDFEGVSWVLHEKEAGYLLARRACEAVVERLLAEGGEYRQLSVRPGAIRGGVMEDLVLSDASALRADRYVFACGPWLATIFPEILGARITPTRQEVFFFGTPPGDPTYLEEKLPVWIDNGARIFYGIPGGERRGFKVADDSHGPVIDPTTEERLPSRRGLRSARDYMEFRFPGMKGAPLLEARVCQYESSPDSRFILDRHPAAENVFIAGGGSGHGFKHGPALGERMADLVLGARGPDPFFALARLEPARGSSPG